MLIGTKKIPNSLKINDIYPTFAYKCVNNKNHVD